MDSQNYLNTRVDDQIAWYEKKSAYYKLLSVLSEISLIILSASIPVLVLFIKGDSDEIKVAIAFIASITSIISATSFFFKFKEQWLEYRTVAETLKHEKIFFLTNSGGYTNSQDAYSKFVERIERLISKSTSDWNRN
jgi:hypothetical protein